YLVEQFQPVKRSLPSNYNTSTVVLNWWLWSDETGSNWPDDDAIARTDSLNIARNQDLMTEGEIRINTHVGQAIANIQLVEIDGTVSLIRFEEGVAVQFDLAITPRVNLSLNTMMYLVLTNDYAVDQYGRQLDHLVVEFKPEIGFSNQQGNTTFNQYLLEPDHLLAAGVDFEEQPKGWRYTVAFIGDDPVSNETRLLSLYHSNLPDETSTINLSSAMIPLFIFIFSGIIFYGILQNSLKRDELIPKLSAQWNQEILHLSITNGKDSATILSWSIEQPWNFKQKPATIQLPSGQQKTFKLTFKSMHQDRLKISIRIEIESLGIWKQQLSIESPHHVQDVLAKS
ncbi:MAG: hypothetical protein VW270_25490, partial [Candidatus Poseidoniales archaeon]